MSYLPSKKGSNTIGKSSYNNPSKGGGYVDLVSDCSDSDDSDDEVKCIGTFKPDSPYEKTPTKSERKGNHPRVVSQQKPASRTNTELYLDLPVCNGVRDLQGYVANKIKDGMKKIETDYYNKVGKSKSKGFKTCILAQRYIHPLAKFIIKNKDVLKQHEDNLDDFFLEEDLICDQLRLACPHKNFKNRNNVKENDRFSNMFLRPFAWGVQIIKNALDTEDVNLWFS
jgi:hypothetical protein